MKILAHAQELIYQLLDGMPSAYQRQSLKALLELFLRAQGAPLPEHSHLKSASALSRFLTGYAWSVRQVIRQVRQAIRQELKRYRPRGRRPHLQVILDMTTLEKRGKFKAFSNLISVFHGKRGVHLVVLYLVIGPWRVPWSFRVYRGKGQPSAAQLGLTLVRQLPNWLKRAFNVNVLADTAFGSVDFLHGIRQLKLHAITGVRYDRKLTDGRQLFELHKPGQRVYLQGLSCPVTIAWFYWKRDGKTKRSKRYVLSTAPLKASTIVWWGRHRWQIEGFFKTAKHRFGLHRFGQQTLLGMYRWFVLSLVAFLLAHWGYLSLETETPGLEPQVNGCLAKQLASEDSSTVLANFAAVARLFPQSAVPGLLVLLPEDNRGEAALTALAQLVEAVPQIPVALALTVTQVQYLLNEMPESRAKAMLRGGLIEARSNRHTPPS